MTAARRRSAAGVAALGAGAARPGAAAAQRPARPRPTPARPAPAQAPRDTSVRPPSGTGVNIGGAGGDTTRAPGDTARRPAGAAGDSLRAAGDSAAADSALVTFAEDDSTITALRARPGYDVVRYQGDTVRFLAQERVLILRGAPAAVERGPSLLVGRTVRYDDSLRVVTAVADSTAPRDSVVLRDPSQGSDVIVRGQIRYDLEERRGIVSGFSTSVAQGETWFVSGGRGAFATDSTRANAAGAGRTFYAHDGNVTSCEDETPHYHFQARDIKFVSKSLLVIRPAVLYIGNVPVLWLPFVFQDTRPGRRSGLLRPTFGVAELLRNSPNYQRSVRNLGYYTTLGDYADVRAWLDFRSGARPGQFGFGFQRYNLQSRYKVIDRFIDGDVAVAYERQSDGLRNLTASLQHTQAFNQNRRVNANINFTQNTTAQRRNQFNPFAVAGNTASSVNFSDRYGPVSVGVGGRATQYAGRPTRDVSFPEVNLTSPTISVTPWLDWTPTASFSNAQTFRLDRGPQFGSLYRAGVGGRVDSTGIRASTRNTSARFDTPVKIAGFTWQNSFSFAEQVNDYPQLLPQFYRDITDSTTREARVFAQTFTSSVDWNTSFALPSFFQGTWNVTPSVSLNNVDAAGLLVRTERSGGRWVAQRKRVTASVGAAPTFYAFLPGVFGAERLRHSLSPSISLNYSPTANVSNEYLAARGILRQTYLGALRQNSVSLTLNTNLEAKLPARAVQPAQGDTAAPRDSAGGGRGLVAPLSGGSANAEGRKVKVLSLNFSAINYDFVISDTVTGRLFSRRGFTNDNFSVNGSTDLIPGLSFNQQFSLYRGAANSDTAVFRPYRTSTNLSFNLDRSSALFGAVARIFGVRLAPRADPSLTPTQSAPGARPGGDPAFAAAARAQRAAGNDLNESQFGAPTQDFQLSVTYSEQRQRNDIVGALGRFDPTTVCRGITNPVALTQCEANALANPAAGDTVNNNVTIGGQLLRVDPTRTLQANSSFNITQKWSAQWSTTYDVARARFASNQVQLARELHDWRATFAYTAAQNGNSLFSFFISLKAQPDVSFPYNRQTTRAAR